MKKYFAVIILFFIISGISCKKDQVVRNGYINFFVGDVFIVEDGKKTSVAVGDTVSQGNQIETGANGVVEIYLGEHMVKVLENSTVVINELSVTTDAEGEKSLFYVKKGGVFSRITKKLNKNSDFIIKTPTTVASVRGTDFMVSQKDKKGLVACLNGKIEVLNVSLSKNNSLILNGGEEVEVEENKPMSIRELSEHNRQNIRKIINDFKQMRKEIRDKFIEEREKYRKDVRDQKEKNQQMINEQKQKDQENIDAIKGETKDAIDEAKDTSDIKKIKDSSAVEKEKEKTKGLLDKVKPSMDDVKPKIKK